MSRPSHSHDCQPLVQASARYFDELLIDVAAGESFGEVHETEEANFIIGVTPTDDFKEALLVVDAYRRDNDPKPLLQPQPTTAREILTVCAKAALYELFPDVLEDIYDPEEMGDMGLVLFAEKNDFADEQSERQWLDGLESAAFPIPVDRARPVHGYLFSSAFTEGDYEPFAIGAAVFETGGELGDDPGVPPYYIYAERVAVRD